MGIVTVWLCLNNSVVLSLTESHLIVYSICADGIWEMSDKEAKLLSMKSNHISSSKLVSSFTMVHPFLKYSSLIMKHIEKSFEMGKSVSGLVWPVGFSRQLLSWALLLFRGWHYQPVQTAGSQNSARHQLVHVILQKFVIMLHIQ